MNRIYSYFLFLSLLSLAATCEKDTCNDLATFGAITANVEDSNDTQIRVGITWTNPSNLPLPYFEDNTLMQGTEDLAGKTWQNDHEFAEKIVATELGKFELLLKKEILQEPRTYHFHFLFSDRRNYIECNHSGSNDLYQLDLAFQVTQANGEVIIKEFDWEEILFRGGI